MYLELMKGKSESLRERKKLGRKETRDAKKGEIEVEKVGDRLEK